MELVKIEVELPKRDLEQLKKIEAATGVKAANLISIWVASELMRRRRDADNL